MMRKKAILISAMVFCSVLIGVMGVEYAAAADYYPDSFEYNDNTSSAGELLPDTYTCTLGYNSMNTDDTDWYKVHLNAFDTLTVSTYYNSADGWIQLNLYDTTTYNQLDSSEQYTGYEEVSAMVEENGYYYLRLYFSEAYYMNLTYTISISITPFSGPYGSTDWITASPDESYEYNYTIVFDNYEGSTANQDGSIFANFLDKQVGGPHLILKFGLQNIPKINGQFIIDPSLTYKVVNQSTIMIQNYFELILFGIYPVVPKNFFFGDPSYGSVFYEFPGTIDFFQDGKSVKLNYNDGIDIMILEIDYSVEGILQRYYIKMDITSSPTDNMYFQFEMKIQDSDDKNENPESPFKIPGFSLPIMGNFAIITIVGLVTLTKKRKS